MGQLVIVYMLESIARDLSADLAADGRASRDAAYMPYRPEIIRSHIARLREAAAEMRRERPRTPQEGKTAVSPIKAISGSLTALWDGFERSDAHKHYGPKTERNGP